MGICRMFVLLAILLIDTSDCEFTATPGTISGCNTFDVTLSWNIKNYSSVSTVQWKKQGITIMSQSGKGTPKLSAGVTNAEHCGDGAIVIKGVQSNDTGEYSCHITYTPGSSNLASSSTATLSLIAPLCCQPILTTVAEKGSIKYTCSVTTKCIPEVNVTVKVGDDELPTHTASVLCGNHKDISCCITGDAFGCLSENERCVKQGGIGARKKQETCSWPMMKKENAMKGCGVSECVLLEYFILAVIVCAVVLLVILPVAIVTGVQIRKRKPNSEEAEEHIVGSEPFSQITENQGRNEPSSQPSSKITENQGRNEPSSQPFSQTTENPGRNEPSSEPSSQITENPDRNDPSSQPYSKITENQGRNEPSMVVKSDDNTTSGEDARYINIAVIRWQ